jgi:hypothetical protein
MESFEIMLPLHLHGEFVALRTLIFLHPNWACSYSRHETFKSSPSIIQHGLANVQCKWANYEADDDISGPPARWWVLDLLSRCCDAWPSYPFVVPYTRYVRPRWLSVANRFVVEGRSRFIDRYPFIATRLSLPVYAPLLFVRRWSFSILDLLAFLMARSRRVLLAIILNRARLTSIWCRTATKKPTFFILYGLMCWMRICRLLN